MKAASRIQSSILPRRAPSMDGLQIAVRYLPMAAVGGDFYDFLVVDDKRLGVLVADVSGHGVPAALVASMVKVALSERAADADNPARVIAGLNHVLCRQVEGQVSTAGYLFLDAGKPAALYSAAGHPPLLLWRKSDRTIHQFRENGLLLGFRPDACYSNLCLELQPGDRLLLYTDGIIEATNTSDEFFGEERLHRFIEAHDELPADAFADSLLHELSIWTGTGRGGAQADDLTLLVVDLTKRAGL